ncbi:phage protein [Escherichia coli]|nr:phage protein [Escherichia coli]VEC38353.1 phage protein [Escherichia coli]
MNDKELIKEIKERISSLDVRDNVERRAYEIALASLTAEPVAWKVTFTQIDREYNTFTGMYSDKAEVERWVRLHKACNFRADITPLYTAKPVPVTQDGWISCSDRMPEIRQTVIGWNGYAVRQCVYTRNEYAKTQKGREPRFETLTGIWHGVTHWMPLPEPPQGG